MPKTTSRSSIFSGSFLAAMQGPAKSVDIDLTKAIVPQLSRLGDDYEEWVHKPSMQKEFRLFNSDFMEFFSRTPWYAVPLIWLPVVAAFAFLSATCVQGGKHLPPVCKHVALSDQGTTLATLLGGVGLGVFCWTLIEYCLHRFLFHIPAKSPFFIHFHFMIHGLHHKFPMDHLRLVFPVLPATILAVPFFYLFHALFPLHLARAVFAGALLGYVTYDLIHYYVHHGRPSIEYFASLKTDHMNHHFQDPNKGFGISSKLWDIPFGTLQPQRVKQAIRNGN